MKLIISGRAAVKSILADPKTTITHIVSIGADTTIDARQTEPSSLKKHPAKKLRLEFFDISEEKRGKMNGPTKADIENLIKFFNEVLKENNPFILIHCYAGRSRSAAAGLILLNMYYKDYKKAINKLYKVVPNAMPNKRMLKLAGLK